MSKNEIMLNKSDVIEMLDNEILKKKMLKQRKQKEKNKFLSICLKSILKRD